MRDLAVLRSFVAARARAARAGSFLRPFTGPALAIAALVGVVSSSVGACANAGREGFDNVTDSDGNDPGPGVDDGDGGGGFGDGEPIDAGDPEVHEIYGHSDKVLYRLDPKTNDVVEVGSFRGCAPVVDLAMDENANIFADSYDALYTVDKTTGECTQIATGKDLPNSLAFVPRGTVDGDREALVGFDDADYVRIDVATGQKSRIGSLKAGNLISSGDIASVKGGSTYLTVKPNPKVSTKTCQNDKECKRCMDADCLVEIDPSDGHMIKNWGPIEHKDVFGLAFWGGKVYGFDKSGQLFEVTFGTSQIITKDIPIPSKPSDLSFWGAGSSTSVPIAPPPA